MLKDLQRTVVDVLNNLVCLSPLDVYFDGDDSELRKLCYYAHYLYPFFSAYGPEYANHVYAFMTHASQGFFTIHLHASKRQRLT